MADGMRPESFLPTIKCSTCGQEIDMMALADHVCGPPNPLEQVISHPGASKKPLGMDPAIQQADDFLAPQSSSPGFLRPSRNVPPRIDLAAANRPFAKVDQLTPQSAYSNYSDAQSSVAAPTTPSTQVTTPSSMFSRRPFGAFASRTPSPPSPDLASNLDSAFPMFPSKFNEKPQSRNGNRPLQPDRMAVPPSPRANPGIDVMERMNTVAPGPFGAQRGRQAEQGVGGASNAQTQRNPSGGKQFRNQGGKEHFRKQSSTSVKSQTSERSIDRQNRWEREGFSDRGDEIAAIPPPAAAASIDRYLNDLPLDVPPPMLSPDFRSKTFPDGQERRFQPQSANSELPPPSAPPTRSGFFPSRNDDDVDRPTTSDGPVRGYGGFGRSADSAVQPSPKPFAEYDPFPYGQPPDATPSTGRSRSRTLAKPSMSNASGIISAPFAEAPRARSRTLTRPSGPSEISRFDGRQENAPPLPYSGPSARRPSGKSERSDRSHIPTNSDSSYASSNLSTLATSDGSVSRSGSNSDDGRQRSNSRSQRGRPDFYAPPPPPAAGGFYQSMESPTDPAIQKGSFKPPRQVAQPSAPFTPAPYAPAQPDARPYEGRPLPPVNVSPPRMQRPQENPRLPMRVSPPRRRQEPVLLPREREEPAPLFRQPAPPVSKGDCRGCGTAIFGKSVKAADGRLTGRYHKECFVCKTCQAPFPGAEFYVLNNSPYCERHYHQLNGSICRRCNRGIEGQYLETDGREKYHAACFCCSRCMVRLREDYYEVDGRPVCDRHAFESAPSDGGLAPAFERRRTKLMMI